MATSLELYQTRERLRVGRRFLGLRPKIAALGGLGNAAFLVGAGGPTAQAQLLALSFGLTVGAFYLESRWLARRELSERWLRRSLGATLATLGVGALLSGGLSSPILPLLFAPVVVGFAAFGRGKSSKHLLYGAVSVLLALALIAPLPGLPAPPESARLGMLLTSALTSFALLAVGVIGLVDAHTAIAAELERLRADMLGEAERRALSVEQLGAQVAHEVKNPLAAARGLVELVQRRLHDDKDRQRLAVVVAEVDRAVSVLEDYLSFARPLSNLALGPVGARELLEDVAKVLEARAHDKNVAIEVSARPLTLWADRQRLRDAVLNLALNAVSALPAGGRLTLAASEAGDSIALSVVDDGPGIDPNLLPRLGQPYASRSEGGTGLGVLLAQSVARQHGGRLRFESTPSIGTRAELQLPARAAGVD